MDFAQYVNRVDALYTTLLEEGGQDSAALKIGIETAHKALEKMPDEVVATLSPAQQRHRESLLLIAPHLAAESTGAEERREWLEAARSFLVRLPH
jgi:hypothetical protein